MRGRAFVDTNVFVCFRDSSEAKKQRTAYDLLNELWATGSGRISTQVCNEYYVTVTRKLDPGLSPVEAWEDVVMLEAWHPLSIGMPVLHRAREIESKYGISWWDALIVSAASLLECDIIYSEDLGSGQSYSGVRVVNPFE
jgi:predicted nucleic acid-binding protein